MKVQTVESRVNRVLDALNRLALIGNNLILRVDYIEFETKEPPIEELEDIKKNWFHSVIIENWIIFTSIGFEFILIPLAFLVESNIAARISLIVFAVLFFLIGIIGLVLNLKKK